MSTAAFSSPLVAASANDLADLILVGSSQNSYEPTLRARIKRIR